MKPRQVTVYPCGGVGLVVSSVSRRCGLHLTEDLLPERIDLLDMHRLLLGEKEEMRLVARQPVLVIDGCNYQCGSNFLWLLKLKPALRFYVPGFMAKFRLKPGPQRAVLIEAGQKLARLIAQYAARLAEAILGGDYDFTPREVFTGPVRVCDFSVEVEDKLRYIDVLEPCVHRPEDMPAIPGEGALTLDPLPVE